MESKNKDRKDGMIGPIVSLLGALVLLGTGLYSGIASLIEVAGAVVAVAVLFAALKAIPPLDR